MQFTMFMKGLLLAANIAIVTAAPTPQSRGGCYGDATGFHCDSSIRQHCYDNAKGEHICVTKRGIEGVTLSPEVSDQIYRRGGCWIDASGQHCDDTQFCWDNEEGQHVCVVKRDTDDEDAAAAVSDDQPTASSFGGGCWVDENGVGHCDNTPYCYDDDAGQHICVVKRDVAGEVAGLQLE